MPELQYASPLFPEPDLEEKIVVAKASLLAAIQEHQPKAVFALFSGGYDSLTATHLAMTAAAVTSVVHVNTGIGIEDTREFVRKTCGDFGWKLDERHPPDKTYLQIILEYGFPGPPAHRYMYVWLKERALDQLVRETKMERKDRIMFVSGVRSQESVRRMGYTTPVKRDGAKVWVAPIYDFNARDVVGYLKKYALPRNPVVEALGMSGECLCGAFAHPGELVQIEKHFPRTGAYIRSLEEQVRAAGFPWGWEDRPPVAESKQEDLENIFDEDDRPFMPLCACCEHMTRKVY